MKKTACALIMLVLIAGCKKADKPGIEAYPILGREPVMTASFMEDHSEMLAFWAKNGFKDMIAIHIDARDDLGFVPDDKIDALKDLIAKKDWEGLEAKRDIGDKSLYRLDNYLYAAAKTGIIKKIYWVIPYGFFGKPDSETRIKEFLKSTGSVFDPTEVDALKFNRACVEGRLKAVDISICSAAGLPVIKEPVLIDIDLDYFPVAAFERRLSRVSIVKEFFDIMAQKGYRVAGAGMAYSLRGGSTRAIHRYIGDEITAILLDPSVLHLQSPPPLWAALDHAENMLSGGEDRMVMDYLASGPLRDFPKEPSLMLINGMAALYARDAKTAFKDMTRACEISKRDCYGLLDAAKHLMEQGKYAESEKFFKSAMKTRPGWNEAVFNYANLLYRTKRYKEMLAAYAEVEKTEDTMYLQMYTGDAYYMLGRRDEALARYERAMSYHDPLIGYEFNERNAEPLERMASIYKERGMQPEFIELQGWSQSGGAFRLKPRSAKAR